MKILILGGTGAMGMHLCKLLVQKGADVSVTTRQRKFESNDIKYIQGNAKFDVILKSLISEPWDCIVDFLAYSTSDFQKRLPLLLGNTHQYIFLSSARVYANSDEPITEFSPRLLDVSKDEEYLKTDEYALAKARQEDLLINSCKKNWTIIRPYITYAEERLQLGVMEKEAWLFRALQGRTVVICNEIAEKTTTLTYGLDVAGAIAGLVGSKKALGEIFHITSDFARSWKDILTIYCNAIAEISSKDLKFQYVDLSEFLKTHSGYYQIKYDRMYNRVFDNSKIRSIFTTDDFITPEVGLRECLNEFLINPQFHKISGRDEAIRDRITSEITSLKYFQGLKEKALYLLHLHNIIK